MPTVLRIGNFRFHFYSDEYNEPPYVHIATSDGECKFWLEPITLAKNIGLKGHVIREIEKLLFQYSEFLKDKYYEFHSNR